MKAARVPTSGHTIEIKAENPCVSILPPRHQDLREIFWTVGDILVTQSYGFHWHAPYTCDLLLVAKKKFRKKLN